MSHFDLRRFKAIPDLRPRIFFFAWADFDHFFSSFNLLIYSPTILSSSQNWETGRRGMAVLTGREVDGIRTTSRFLSKVDFFPPFQSWLKRPKEGFDPHSEHLEITEFQVDE